MANTYTLIQAQTLASSAASVTFSSIPATYTDLVLRVSARNTTSSEIFDFGFNGVTTNQSSTYLNGSGSAATSAQYTLYNRSNPSTSTASTFSNSEIYIPNYAGNTNKPVSMVGANENNGTTIYMNTVAGLWSSTAAITSITCTAPFATGSSFYLYGIKNS
jgi:hypothetical protein